MCGACAHLKHMLRDDNLLLKSNSFEKGCFIGKNVESISAKIFYFFILTKGSKICGLFQNPFNSLFIAIKLIATAHFCAIGFHIKKIFKNHIKMHP